MITQGQMNDIFTNEYGRVATPAEYEQYKNASLSTIANLSPAQLTNTSVTPTTSPYDVPSVVAASQNLGTIGSAINAGNQEIADIQSQKTANAPIGITTEGQLNSDIKATQAPVAQDLRTLGKQYSAARSTYSSVFSAAKSAISAAKSQAGASQRDALTEATKIIDLLKTGQLDINKIDKNQLSSIEQSSGLPSGFFSSIAPKTTTPKADNIRSVGGGLYDVTTKEWILPSTKKTSSASNTSFNMEQYLANQGLPLTIATSKGALTKTALNRAVSAGVPLNVANGLWANMVNGNTFDEIRQGLRSQGVSPDILDTFVQSLQKTTSTTPTTIPGP